MSPIKYLIIIVFVLLIVIVFIPRKMSTKTITIKDQIFNIEVAKSPRDLATGLSNRSELCSNCGMLFVFPYNQILSFWMKDTSIPLDMIFLDENGKILNIVTATPQSLDIHQSISPARYCLELNAGTSAKLNLSPGDQLNL